MAVYVNTIVCTTYKCSEFGQFLIIFHIPVKEVQSKKDDRGNIQEIFIDTYSFLLVKAHRNHNISYEDVDIFFPLRSHSGYLIVSPLSPGYFNLTYNVNSLF